MVLADGEIAVMTTQGIRVYKDGIRWTKRLTLLTGIPKRRKRADILISPIKEINEQQGVAGHINRSYCPDYSGVELKGKFNRR